MDQKFKALLALLGTVFFWSFLVVIARAVVVEIRPMTLLFFRLLVAAIFFLPFFIWRQPWKNPAFNKLAFVSLLSTVNLAFFMWGIQFTTASASQLIYAAQPILIIISGTFFRNEDYPIRKILGVLVGLLGIFIVVYLSAVEKGTTIVGSLTGNLAIIIAMLGWLSYLLFSKKLSQTFTPIEIGSVSILVSFIVSTPLFLLEVVTNTFYLPITGILAASYMGLFGTFFTYILYQYGIRHASPLTVSFTSYIQPITTAILAIILLGEKLTLGFIFGGALVFLGVFLATTLEFLHRRK